MLQFLHGVNTPQYLFFIEIIVVYVVPWNAGKEENLLALYIFHMSRVFQKSSDV
jgi:hypothetical protein